MKLNDYSMKIICLNIAFLSFLFPQELSLKECIYRGLKNNSTLRSTMSGVSIAEQSLKNSYSRVLPSIGFTGRVNRTYFPERESFILDYNELKMDTSSFNNSRYLSTGISITQKLYDGSQSLNQIRQAKILFENSNLNYSTAKLKLIQNVIISYFEFLKAKELRDVAIQNLSLSENQLELVKTQFDIGAVKKTDLLKGKVIQGQAQSEILRSNQSLRNKRRNLFNAMGISDSGEEFTDFTHDIFTYILPKEEVVVKAIEENNPSVLSNKNRTKAAKLNYLIAKGIRMPSISAGLDYSAVGETYGDWVNNLKNDWNLGVNLSLSIPIYMGNGISTQIEQKRIEWHQSTEDYTTLKENLDVQALDLLDILNYHIEILPIQSQVVESAREDLSLVQERYALGAASILEVLDAQVSLNSAKTGWVNLKYDFWIYLASLQSLTGELTPDFGIN
tara:strand:- start:213 stop:1556 length:1344 start_codon:yes stop_codon:yes gene_type:complete